MVGSARIGRMGSWASPISSAVVVKGAGAQKGKPPDVRLGGCSLAPGGATYWLEGRPSEGGRSVIVANDGTELTPEGINVRTRVHEYGGGAWSILASKGVVVFSDFSTQRLYQQSLDGGVPSPLTPDIDDCALRFADFELDEKRNRLVCVMEDHRSSEKEPVNSLAAIKLDGSCEEPTVLVDGASFYAAPKLSADGMSLAFMCWDHPSMPWSVTSLMKADLADDGSITDTYLVSGGLEKEEAPQQPQWTPDGRLIFISDRDSGWWNIWEHNFADGKSKNLLPEECEFGGPLWSLGLSTYRVLDDNRILCGFASPESSVKKLAILSSTGELQYLDCPYATFSSLCTDERGRIGIVGGSANRPSEVAVRSNAGEWTVMKTSSALSLDEKYFSEPRKIKFPSKGGRISYMYYYPPTNGDYQNEVEVKEEERELPPLLVKIHGGPTSCASPLFNLTIQYWTSRGFAVADVDFGGSTGYGRAYRDSLRHNWGVVDVEDAAGAAQYLAEKKLADPLRLAIDGGSAGGFTTLAALTFTETFSAGACYYGISNLEALAAETHKFESRYLDFCVGPYPQEIERYKSRSPINHLEKISAPVCLFHGSEDKVCPPNQAEMMYEKALELGLPTALEIYQGEQHGFRKEENIMRVLDAEYSFYSQVWKMEEAEFPEGFQKIDVKNL